MNRNGPVLLRRAQSFPAPSSSHLTLRAVCECRASLLQPSTSLWHSLLEYHLSDQPCQSFHSSSSRAYMKIASVPRATTAASGNWSARKTNTALAGDPGCPGSALGCPPGLRLPALEPQGETGRKRLPGARPSNSSGVAALSLPVSHCGEWYLDTLLSRDLPE